MIDCNFENGKCVYCGYETQVSNLHRNCPAKNPKPPKEEKEQVAEPVTTLREVKAPRKCGGCGGRRPDDKRRIVKIVGK